MARRLLSFLSTVLSPRPPTPALSDSASLSQAASSSSLSLCHGSDDSESLRPCRSSSPAQSRSSTGNFSNRGTSSPNIGTFAGAHHLLFNNCNFQDIQLVQQPLNYVLERLENYTFTESSSGEDNPSQCHPDTRQRIITRARTFHSPNREKNLLWISGPAGAGKTAIMKSIAELEKRRLAAKVFFSRANGRSDSRIFVTTIAYQLAVRLPRYQRYLFDLFAADPRLLDTTMTELFKILIETHFRNQITKPETEPWLILIDGLDECEGGDRTQREIVELIGSFARQFPSSPFVWVVASRPEHWLKTAFSIFETSCYQENLTIDTPEARRDVETFLQSQFKRIRSKYPDQFSADQVWPSESQFSNLTKPASGLFLYASTASRFIEDPAIGNPIEQLSVLLSAIGKPGTAGPGKDPLSPLHDLYLHILDSIPQLTYRTTRRILGCCKLLSRNTIHSTSFTLSCNFLGIFQNDAYASLQLLHSVLDIPSPTDAPHKEIRVLHTSFSDLLETRAVAQDYHIGRRDAAADIIKCSFRILQQANNGPGPFPRPSNIVLTWSHEPERTREAMLTTAYDEFRLLTVLENDETVSQCTSLLAEVDYSKLDNYSSPSMKTSVHKKRPHHLSLFEWLINKRKSTPDAVPHLVRVKEYFFFTVFTRSIRDDRSIIHIQFTTSQKGSIVVRPKVYSGCKKIREKYKGDDLEAFKRIFRSRRREFPTLKLQLWGNDPLKSCLLFQLERDERPRDGADQIVKEIFFIPYIPGK